MCIPPEHDILQMRSSIFFFLCYVLTKQEPYKAEARLNII